MIISAAIDYRKTAKRRLPKFLFDYLDGGSYGEYTLNKNITDLAAILLRQRILQNIKNLNLEIELFKQKLSMPLIIAPIGAPLALR